MNHMPENACVFLDRLSLDLGDLDLSAIENMTHFRSYDSTTPQQVVERTSDAEIIIVNKVVLNEALLRQLPRLKLICVIATGINNIDLAVANELGIKVCNVKDYSAAAVSQHVFMLILALYTNFTSYQNDIQKGEWQAQDQFCLLSHPIFELKGKTLGIIGYGHIARAVHRIALAFEMKVIIAQSLSVNAEPSTDRVSLTELLKQSDIVTIHCPLTELSRNLIAAAQFRQMKNSALLINTARGGIVNEQDLIEALTSGEIAGAGIDSIAEEPPSPSNPIMQQQLPQLIVTPHNAWGAVEARQRLVDGTAANIESFLDGKLDQPDQIQSLTA